MECETCKQEAERLVYLGDDIWGCNKCSEEQKNTIGITKVLTGNKYYRNMSYAMLQHIKTRRIREDGKSSPAKRWK